MDVIGILDSASPESRGDELEAFFDGLASAGVTGQDAMILYAWANNNYPQLSGLAQQLIDNNDVRVIVAAGGPVSALAVRSLTTTKPIVFTTITNPITSQLVLDLNAPGGNATGTWGHTTELDPVRLKALCDLTPGGGPIGILTNPNRPHPISANAPVQKGGLESKASDFGRSAIVVDAENDSQIDGAFATFNGAIAGLLVTADPFFNNRRERVIELAANLGVPAIYQWSGFVEDGGLMSYGPSKEEGYFNAGEMAGDILKNGAQPATLPVRQTNAFALVINDDTAATVGVNLSGPAFRQMVANLGVTDIRHI
jgi:putative ABC transport system substrate-binding protein